MALKAAIVSLAALSWLWRRAVHGVDASSPRSEAEIGGRSLPIQ